MNVNELIDDYYEKREAYDVAHAISVQAHKEMRAAEEKVVNAMLEEGNPLIGRDDGTRVALRKSFSCSVTQENNELIRQWLLDSFGDDTPFVKEAVSKPALIEKLKEMDLSDDEYPPFLRVSSRPTLTVNGWNDRTQWSRP